MKPWSKSLLVQFSPSAMFDFATPWTAVHQASLSITNSQSLLKLMSTELVMASNHLVLCHLLLLLPSIFPSIFSKMSVLHMAVTNKDWIFLHMEASVNDFQIQMSGKKKQTGFSVFFQYQGQLFPNNLGGKKRIREDEFHWAWIAANPVHGSSLMFTWVTTGRPYFAPHSITWGNPTNR